MIILIITIFIIMTYPLVVHKSCMRVPALYGTALTMSMSQGLKSHPQVTHVLTLT
jgi:hypothetical protein